MFLGDENISGLQFLINLYKGGKVYLIALGIVALVCIAYVIWAMTRH
jgi:hypothetical protein